MVNFSDFDGVIGEVVMDDKGKLFGDGVESKYAAIVIEELLL